MTTLSVSSTSCRRCGHCAGADAQDAADDLGDPLQEQQEARDRDQRLQRKHRHAGRAEDADLAEAHRHLRVVPARIHQRRDRRQEEQDVEDEIHARLGARLPEPVDHVGAHMAVARERVGAGHQEHRAVGDVADVERPGGRRAQHVAHEHLVADAEREHEDQPGERLADPGAEFIDEEKKLGHASCTRCRSHIGCPPPLRSDTASLCQTVACYLLGMILSENRRPACSGSCPQRSGGADLAPPVCCRKTDQILITPGK